MSEIIIDKQYQEFFLEHDEHTQVICLRLGDAKRMLQSTPDLRLFVRVDGWGDAWELFVDNAGTLRAQCPTDKMVTPAVKYGSIISTSGRIDKEQIKDEIMNIEIDERKIPKESPKNRGCIHSPATTFCDNCSEEVALNWNFDCGAYICPICGDTVTKETPF